MPKIRQLGWGIAILVIALGNFWAFQRGGNDFKVFYSAAEILLSGRVHVVYLATPDRFLYAPGFAFWMIPFAIFPFLIALALWCALKTWLLVKTLRATETSMAPWAVVILAKPILIDFQYGQINLVLICLAYLALKNHYDGLRRRAYWFFLGALSLSKLILFPLALVPLFGLKGIRKVRFADIHLYAFWGGVLITALLPLSIVLAGKPLSQVIEMYWFWHGSLIDRGIPLESHNQSFLAFLFHVLSGVPTHVVSLHEARDYGLGLKIPASYFSMAAAVWAILVAVALVKTLWRSSGKPIEIGLILSLVILPSHLVWKPYFVFGIPLVVSLLDWVRWDQVSWKKPGVILGTLVFVALLNNATGFDVIGYEWAAKLEAWSVLLWAHLLIIGLVLFRQLFPSRALGSS